MGRMASSFLIKKEQVVASNEVLPNPSVSAETLEACALIGLHLLAGGGDAGSSRSPSSGLGDLWRQGCPKARNGSAVARQARPSLAVRCMSATTSAGLSRSSGRIGQARWCSFSRIGSLEG